MTAHHEVAPPVAASTAKSDARLLDLLCCPMCLGNLEIADGRATCGVHAFPVERGIPRLLPHDLPSDGGEPAALRARTRRSFGYEWRRFRHQLPAYRENFDWYIEPLAQKSVAGCLVLDAGCGMGRHTHHFLARGARVVAIDVSPAIDVAARNNASENAVFVQGDVLRLPVKPDSFDLAFCVGVLHHLEETASGLAELVKALRPGGSMLIYVYHDPAELAPWRGRLVSVVSAMRRVTTRLPMPVLWAGTWGLSVVLFALYLGPMKTLGRLRRLRETLVEPPLGLYTRYPFRVLWHDQFDRFSAPLEKRFRRSEVERLLADAGLVSVRILGRYGWRASGSEAYGGASSLTTMCGVAVSVPFRKRSPGTDLLCLMVYSLRHQGPDAEGNHAEGGSRASQASLMK